MFVAILCFDANWPFCKGKAFAKAFAKPLHSGHFCRFSKSSHFSNIRCFFDRFLKKTAVMCLWSRFSHVFSNFIFWRKLTILQRLWPLDSGHFSNFQNRLIFRILGVFSIVFWKEQRWCSCRVVFRMFLAILFFDANWPFCKGYSVCIVAIFADFQNRLISRILGVSSIVNWKEQRWCACKVVFRMFLAIFCFDANRPFSKDYSVCIVAIFADFQNRLIFRILGAFSSVFWKEQL